jgi:DNA-binding MarR family transcriptional regulator
VTRLARLLRRQDGSDLTPTQGAALATVERHGPLTLGDLAGHEQVSAPTATNVVTKLEAKGLVRRRRDAADRRVCRVEITTGGRRRLEASRDRKAAWLASRLDELAPADRERLLRALDVLEALTTAPER